MNSSIFIRLIYALWFILITYLIVSAIRVKQDTQAHLLQRLGLMLAIIAAFLLPHLPIFRFLNFAPANSVVSTIGVILCAAGMAVLVWAREDKLMEQQFPSEYPAYKKRSKALIPFVW